MGEIRGKHSSPGVYTKYTKRGNRVLSKNESNGIFKSGSAGGTGGGGGVRPTPDPTSAWVLGDTLPAILS